MFVCCLLFVEGCLLFGVCWLVFAVCSVVVCFESLGVRCCCFLFVVLHSVLAFSSDS